MIWFILLAILLVLAIIFFTVFPILTIKMSNEQYAKFCSRKVKRIAKRYSLPEISDLNILSYGGEKIYVNHVIFGKKYIYLITPIKLKGFVVGEENDESWIHYNYSKKHAKYISNLNELANKSISEFASILGVNKDPFKSIMLIPNNCDFKIKGNKNQLTNIVHYFSLKRKIKKLEKSNIDSLDQEQIYEHYKAIKETSK